MWCNGASVGVIAVNKGLTQGDPLSPVIFNMVADELLADLDTMRGLSLDSNESLSLISYTDEPMLMADNILHAQSLLNRVVNFVNDRGSGLNVAKYSSLVCRSDRPPAEKTVC